MIQKIPLLSLWLRERRISCKYLINQTSLCLTATDKLSQKSCSFHPFVLRDTKNSTGEMQRIQRGCFDHVFLQTVGCGLPSKNVHRVGLRTVVPVSSAVIKFLCISFHWNLKSYLHLEKKNVLSAVDLSPWPSCRRNHCTSECQMRPWISSFGFPLIDLQWQNLRQL